MPPVTVAIEELPLLHVPPDTPSVSVPVAPGHTLAVPAMLPAPGAELIEVTWIADALPQALVTVYLIVSSPASTPVTTPDTDTVAFAFATLHIPPVAASVNVVVAPAHTPVAPVMLPAEGDTLTVMTFVAYAVPQLPVIV